MADLNEMDMEELILLENGNTQETDVYIAKKAYVKQLLHYIDEYDIIIL